LLVGLVGVVGVVALAALVLGACSAGPATPAESFDPGAPQLTAKGELFDKAELDVPSDAAFEIVLFNRDSSVHNVSIYADEGHTRQVFKGDLAGTGTKVYHVPALAAGTYYFMCDVHPAMKGTVVAAPD
jgi:plastocyanin